MNNKWLIGIAVVIVLAFIGRLAPSEKDPVVETAFKNAPSSHDKHEAYGMACQFMQKRFDAVNFEWTDEVEDFGTNEWLVSGNMMCNGDRYHWTVQVRRSGEEWSLVNKPVVRRMS